MKYFTDETGAKFEILFQYPAQFPIQECEIVIRPVAEPKWEIRLREDEWGRNHDDYLKWAVEVALDISRDQALLIKQKVEKLLKEHFDE